MKRKFTNSSDNDFFPEAFFPQKAKNFDWIWGKIYVSIFSKLLWPELSAYIIVNMSVFTGDTLLWWPFIFLGASIFS